MSWCEKGLWDFIWSYTTTIHIIFFFSKAMVFSTERVIDKKAIIGVCSTVHCVRGKINIFSLLCDKECSVYKTQLLNCKKTLHVSFNKNT